METFEKSIRLRDCDKMVVKLTINFDMIYGPRTRVKIHRRTSTRPIMGPEITLMGDQ